MEGERAYLNETAIAAQGCAPLERAHVYVRPHEVDVHLAAVPGSFTARVVRLVPLGAVLRVELSVPGQGRQVDVELNRERSEALALAAGDTVHLAPRRVRVFPAQETGPDSLTASGL